MRIAITAPRRNSAPTLGPTPSVRTTAKAPSPTAPVNTASTRRAPAPAPPAPGAPRPRRTRVALPADRVRRVVAEPRDLGAVQAAGVERRAKPGHVGRAPETELHQRAAGELDAVTEATRDRDRGEPEEDEGDGEARRPAPPADEVVAGGGTGP